MPVLDYPLDARTPSIPTLTTEGDDALAPTTERGYTHAGDTEIKAGQALNRGLLESARKTGFKLGKQPRYRSHSIRARVESTHFLP